MPDDIAQFFHVRSDQIGPGVFLPVLSFWIHDNPCPVSFGRLDEEGAKLFRDHSFPVVGNDEGRRVLNKFCKVSLKVFPCFVGEFQVLFVINPDNLLPSPDDSGFRDRGLFRLDKIGFYAFPVSHAFDFFPEEVMPDSPA